MSEKINGWKLIKWDDYKKNRYRNMGFIDNIKRFLIYLASDGFHECYFLLYNKNDIPIAIRFDNNFLVNKPMDAVKEACEKYYVETGRNLINIFENDDIEPKHICQTCNNCFDDKNYCLEKNIALHNITVSSCRCYDNRYRNAHLSILPKKD